MSEPTTIFFHDPGHCLGDAASPDPPDIAGYELFRCIGRGGFGDVWLGRNKLAPGPFCAVKIVPKSKGAELAGVREYERLAKTHPNLVPFGHIGETDEFIYCTMPLADDVKGSVDGVRLPSDYEPLTLQWYRQHRRLLSLEEGIVIADGILAALEHLHHVGKAHWDVKPGNILRMNGGWCLADFGLMTSTADDCRSRGTRAYWPPEVAGAQTADGQTVDLYALGKTLYLLLTGAQLDRFPDFVAGSLKLPPDDAQAEELRRIILRACADDPAQRYTSAADMRRALAALKLSRPRRPWGRLLLGAVGMALLVLLGGLWMMSSGPVQIVALDVEGTRDKRRDLGKIGSDCYAMRFDDQVRIRAVLNRPAWCYLIAMNPDGKDQLCHPADEATPPTKTSELDFPVDANKGFRLNDGTGLQAFVLVAARTSLPAYAKWKASLGGLPWQRVDAKGTWRYDGQEFHLLDTSQRGSITDLPGLPKPLSDLCVCLRDRPEVEAIEVVAFPVKAKPPPRP